MKKIVIISGAIVMVAAIIVLTMMFVQTKASLADTKTELTSKVSALTDTQNKLTQANIQLSDVNSKLSDANSQLFDVKNELNKANSTINETADELQTAQDTLAKDEDELKHKTSELYVASTKSVTLQTELDEINQTVNDLTTSLNLYRETFGEVYVGDPVMYVLNDSEPVSWTASTANLSAPLRFYNLVNNPQAVNPTYKQLLDFLKKDMTDSYRYVPDYYMCGNFAETLHNNAEAAGIRTAVVFIQFDEGPGHAIDAFLTTDKGLVYIDDTGTSKRGPANMDCIVLNLKINSTYQEAFLFPSGYYFNTSNDKVVSIEIYW